jgi:hypothetical protein
MSLISDKGEKEKKNKEEENGASKEYHARFNFGNKLVWV